MDDGRLQKSIGEVARAARERISADALLGLKPSEVSRSVKEPPPSELTPEARQLVHLVRGLPPEKVKALLRVVSVVRSVIEE
jgi:hypothetical protein